MICLEPMLRNLYQKKQTHDLPVSYVKIFAHRVPGRWSVWNLCEEFYRESSWQMICLEHMWRPVHRESLTHDLPATHVKIITERVHDRWYVWNPCEDLYKENSWQMICLEHMLRSLHREFLTDTCLRFLKKAGGAHQVSFSQCFCSLRHDTTKVYLQKCVGNAMKKSNFSKRG